MAAALGAHFRCDVCGGFYEDEAEVFGAECRDCEQFAMFCYDCVANVLEMDEMDHNHAYLPLSDERRRGPCDCAEVETAEFAEYVFTEDDPFGKAQLLVFRTMGP